MKSANKYSLKMQHLW